MIVELNPVIGGGAVELLSENASVFVPRAALAGLQGCIREVRSMGSGLVEVTAGAITVAAFRDPEQTEAWFVSFAPNNWEHPHTTVRMHDSMVAELERLLAGLAA